MSIDLDWAKLDTSLSSSLVDLLNRQLASTERPSFIGSVEVTSLEFGSAAPEVELIDLCDIYRDFLEDDDDDDESREPVKVTEGAEDEEGFEWVSRRAAGRHMAQERQPQYHHLPPHVRYGRSPVTDMFASTPALRSPRHSWNGSMSVPNLMDFRPPTFAGSLNRSSPRDPLSPLSPQQERDTREPLKSPSQSKESEPSPSGSQQQQEQEPQPNDHPNLQLHLHIAWHSDLRITLTTSLLINYPSPMFMSLPIKLSVTGLVFTGELAVAYEGERRRVHICILDDLDPYGPAGERPKRDSASSTPPEMDDDLAASGINISRSTKPLPIGQRLLPNIYIESEIGQADKHVLKNVTRVERFIQDVIRKTVEEELVFPNFHTLLMGEQF
jgi:mitochondrial distribution and morphology protein 12